jgi:hypothetical protein
MRDEDSLLKSDYNHTRRAVVCNEPLVDPVWSGGQLCHGPEKKNEAG